MAAPYTLTYQPPAIFQREGLSNATLRGFYAVTAGHTTTANIIVNADFVVLTSGALVRCATNATSILGLSRFGEQQTFAGSTAPNALFGYAQNTSGNLLPGDSLEVGVDGLYPPTVWVEMSLVNTTQWTGDTLIGTTVGIALDTATNLFIADNGQSNKVGIIREKVVGPNIFLPSGTVLGKGQVNDYGVRVWVEMTSTALQ